MDSSLFFLTSPHVIRRFFLACASKNHVAFYLGLPSQTSWKCGFLRGEESELGGDWVEFDWLKAKGYYSMEAFIVNRLEVALRLAWLNVNNGKKRGVKLKEKVNAAGVAANVFWRKKGCVDWWGNLDDVTRRKVLNVTLGKAAKSLVLSRSHAILM